MEAAQISQSLFEYLIKQQYIDLSKIPTDKAHEEILILIKEKDKTIKTLSQDLTKARCENIKLNKLIKELQQKLSQGTSNSNNTATSFMMASEFKTKFDILMKQNVSSVFDGILSQPSLYKRAVHSIMKGLYIEIETKIERIVKNISKQLTEKNEHKIFVQILKILQDNHKQLFTYDYPQIKQALISGELKKNEDIQKIVEGQQFEQFLKQLFNIVVFMQLQESRWEFILPDQKILEYTKKEHNCIDGWVKEKQSVMVLVEGLVKKDKTMHPNLKNYVIPYTQDDSNDRLSGSVCLYKEKQQTSDGKGCDEENKESKTLKIQQADIKPMREEQYKNNLDDIQIKLQHLKNDKLDTKQVLNEINKDKSRDIKFNKYEQPRFQSTSEKRLKSYQEIKIKKLADPVLETRKKKIGVGKIAGIGKMDGLLNDPNFSEMLIFQKHRKEKTTLSEEQIHESRIINKENVRNKKISLEENKQSIRRDFLDDVISMSNNRSKKEKAGRIINQSVRCNANQSKQEHHKSQRVNNNKQNQNLSNNSALKQAIYKEIIKTNVKQQKSVSKSAVTNIQNIRQSVEKKLIFYDPMVIRTERPLKQYQDKRKQENRPLRPTVEHMHRFMQR